MDRILKLFPGFSATFLAAVAPALHAFDATKRVISCSLAMALMAVAAGPATVQAGSPPLAQGDAASQRFAAVTLPTAVPFGHLMSHPADAVSRFHSVSPFANANGGDTNVCDHLPIPPAMKAFCNRALPFLRLMTAVDISEGASLLVFTLPVSEGSARAVANDEARAADSQS